MWKPLAFGPIVTLNSDLRSLTVISSRTLILCIHICQKRLSSIVDEVQESYCRSQNTERKRKKISGYTREKQAKNCNQSISNRNQCSKLHLLYSSLLRWSKGQLPLGAWHIAFEECGPLSGSGEKCCRRNITYASGFDVGICDGLSMVTFELDPAGKAKRYNPTGAMRPISACGSFIHLYEICSQVLPAKIWQDDSTIDKGPIYILGIAWDNSKVDFVVCI